MTTDELAEKLKAIPPARGHWDIDNPHRQADALLLEFIADPRVTAAFNDLELYYHSYEASDDD